MQNHQRMDAFVAFTACIWENLHMTQTMTSNESSIKVGKARWKIKKIEITVLNLNLTYYLVF